VLVRRASALGAEIIIPAGVLAQVWRGGSRQARLAALVGGPATRVEALNEALAKAAGQLCGRRGTADVVDASVVLAARQAGGAVVTADVEDIRRLDPTLTVVAV